MSPENLIKGGVVICVLFACVIAASIWLDCHMEAKVYNRLTGENVTAWDAYWVELRVTSKGKSE